jgi:hypothetical protein
MQNFNNYLLVLLCFAMSIAYVECRMVHKIEDHRNSMPLYVNECRRGCLMKVRNRQDSCMTTKK